jgi:DNA-binding HxlR family transcriptional regulator
VAKSYKQYCPVAHALDAVGERWSLLIVRELIHGPRRYTDLLDRLDGCGTNILAARLRHLEAAGVVAKRKLPPPAASTVYELTEYGAGLRNCLRELAWWGARSLGPPVGVELEAGWLGGALETIGPAPVGTPTVEFRIGTETAGWAEGDVVHGSVADPDLVVEGDPAGFYYLLIERRTDDLRIDGDRDELDRLLDAIGAPSDAVPVATPAS